MEYGVVISLFLFVLNRVWLTEFKEDLKENIKIFFQTKWKQNCKSISKKVSIN